MTSADVLVVCRLLEAGGVTVLIDGGWGIDALIGEQTRPHDDLDVVIDREQNTAAIDILSRHGFLLHHDGRPVSFIMRQDDGRRVDFHPVRFDADGSGWQALPDQAEFCYSREGLAGRGTIAGRPVRCITAELQVACHLGYEPDADDIRDMLQLRDRFGISMPSPYDRPHAILRHTKSDTA